MSAAHSSTRRAVLAGLVAAPALLTFGRARAGDAFVFSLGVASGEPSPDGFVIWTRLAPDAFAADGQGGIAAPTQVHWEVAVDANFRRVVRRGEIVATSALAHAIHVEVEGLASNRPYWYRFTALGQQSAIGRARTAPRPNERLDALKFVYASCAHWEQGYFSAYRHMADEEPDLALFLGDYIYEYSIAARRPAEVVRPYNLEEATTLAGYRNRYALHRTDADLQLLHATAPCLATWDDHEVHDDYSGWWSKDRSVAPSSFLQRRAAAYRAFYEHMPLRRAQLGRGADMLLHRRVEFGRLASFSVLDGRQYRSRQPCDTPESGGKGQIAPASCAELADPSRTLLGFAQERWLYDGLARARAQWNVLAQNLVVAPLRTRLPPSGEAAYWTDTWDGYQSARDRLLEAIELTGPSNPVVLSGDYHSFWANELKRQSDGASVATEFVGTSVTSNGPPHDGIVSIMPENPHIRYFEGRRRGYVSAELNRERMLTRFQAISDRRDPNASVQTLQAFAVESGRGAIETA